MTAPDISNAKDPDLHASPMACSLTLIQRASFDYNLWRRNLDADESIEAISRNAMAFRKTEFEQQPNAQHGNRVDTQKGIK